ncbi:hypothetical protein ACJX0J_037372, partial [Zea mays]
EDAIAKKDHLNTLRGPSLQLEQGPGRKKLSMQSEADAESVIASLLRFEGASTLLHRIIFLVTIAKKRKKLRLNHIFDAIGFLFLFLNINSEDDDVIVVELKEDVGEDNVLRETDFMIILG